MPTSAGKRFKPTKYIPVSTAATLLVGSTTLFFVFTCPWLTKVISPIVPLYNGLVFLFVLANFSMATFMDPGVYPRADEDEDKDDDFRAPLYKNVEIKGIQVRMKWCATCHFYRPPRCSHCSVCDNCVEVTGKFRGGVNPFTKGCCGNVEYVLCSSLGPRYAFDPRKKPHIKIQPPFIRPDLADKQITIKINDNGIHSTIISSKSKSSLDGLDEKETQPPLPPKADRYNQLKNHLTSSEESSLSGKTHPSTPAMYKFRPSFGTMPKVHYHTAGDKIVMPDDPNPSAILEESVRGHDYRSEPNLDLPEYTNAPLHRTFKSSPFQLDSNPVNSRTLSLKQAHQRSEKGQLVGLQPQTVTSTQYKNVFSPNTLSNRNGSLSYDSLLNPSSTPPTAGECMAHRGMPPVGYHSPYLPTKMCHVREPERQRQQVPATYSPVMSSRGVGRHSPHMRDPSPVRYDNLSQTIMASIQERKEMEAREKRHMLLGHSQTHIYAQDSGVFEGSGGYGLPSNPCYPDGPRCAGSRGPTPPAYGGSRDNLMGVGLSYGQRTPVLCQAGSALGRAPRTSSSSLHTDHVNNNHGRVSGLEGLYRSPAHHPHSPAVPRSPSYSHQKLSYMSAQERMDSPRLGGPREAIKVNGQMDCHPSAKGVTASPSRHGNIKKVTGVGGTTYEISV
ncbi:palmitoyltransferase ZDHHC8B isoform X2 [Vanacampus margaritifer]